MEFANFFSFIQVRRTCDERGSRLNQLVADHEALQRLHQQLTREYDNLIKEHNNLKTTHKNLKLEQKELKVCNILLCVYATP